VWIIPIFYITLHADSQTEQIAKKLAMLERELRTAPTTLKIPYDPFFPQAKRVKRDKKKSKSFTKYRSKHKRWLEVTMILNKKAFINGKWVKENQKIADYVVTKIDKDTVFLKRKGKTITLRLISGKSILITKEE
jgi:hypothetical protein